MARFFTADFHLGFDALLQIEKRPFKTIQIHDKTLIDECCKVSKDDTIIHIGDLACFKQDGQSSGLVEKPMDVISQIPAQFINIHGNHDINNKVKSICKSMQIQLGKRFPNVICGHYPSYDPRAKEYIRDGWIILCGHVHGKWRHCLDLDHSCLNINCGVDVWNYKLVSEESLIKYINHILKLPKEDVHKIKNINGKLQNV